MLFLWRDVLTVEVLRAYFEQYVAPSSLRRQLVPHAVSNDGRRAFQGLRFAPAARNSVHEPGLNIEVPDTIGPNQCGLVHTAPILKFLPGCSVLPPLEPPKPRAAATPKAKSAHRKQTRGRFDQINAFTDATLRHLDRGEIAVWLILWRDIKPNGLARISRGGPG